MPVWILLATAGQFLNAVVAILDKHIVSDERILPRPFVYAFYSCLLTGGWLFVYLLGFVPYLGDIGFPRLHNLSIPSIDIVAMAFLSGYTLFMALVSMYTALQKAEAVNVLPVIGSVSAIMAFLFSTLFLNASLTPNFTWGIIVLSLGTLLVAQALPKLETIVHVFHSGLFFAFHFVVMKGLFIATHFDDAFFWSRVGMILFALSLLLVPAYFTKITNQSTKSKTKTGFLIITNKIIAGVAAFMLLKATDMGDVAVVQALDGLKFVFILLISILVGYALPSSAIEVTTKPQVVIRRVLYVAVIVVGYAILFI